MRPFRWQLRISNRAPEERTTSSSHAARPSCKAPARARAASGVTASISAEEPKSGNHAVHPEMATARTDAAAGAHEDGADARGCSRMSGTTMPLKLELEGAPQDTSSRTHTLGRRLEQVQGGTRSTGLSASVVKKGPSAGGAPEAEVSASAAATRQALRSRWSGIAAKQWPTPMAAETPALSASARGGSPAPRSRGQHDLGRSLSPHPRKILNSIVPRRRQMSQSWPTKGRSWRILKDRGGLHVGRSRYRRRHPSATHLGRY